MRILALTLALATLPAMAAEYPLWDGEPIEAYAKKVGLPQTKTIDLGGGVTMEFVLIPAGTFTMGTPKPEPPELGERIAIAAILAAGILLVVAIYRWPQFSLRMFIVAVVIVGVAQYGVFRWWRAAEAWEYFDEDESPAHKVTISTPYYIGKVEVTRAQYQRVIRAVPRNPEEIDFPVVNVSWTDAQEFCRKASQITGAVVRLPSEAEWEYACRAGTKTRFCSGDSVSELDKVAWYGPKRRETIHPVGQKNPNAWGAYDMHGNVWEWCADWYWHGAYNRSEPTVDPLGPTDGEERVLRGGSSDNNPFTCRSANRNSGSPDGGGPLDGVRVVLACCPVIDSE